MNYPQKAITWTLDLLFPIRCIDCGKFSAKKSRYLCKKCMGNIQINKKFECIGCKKSTNLGITCIACQSTNPLDQLLVVSDYNNPLVVKIIKTLKYRFIRDMIIPLSLLIKKYILWLNKSKHLNILAENPIIIPVPLHYYRSNWRGFNQAGLIAESLSGILNCDSNPSILERTNKNIPQADIKEREQRLKNIGEIFRVADSPTIKDRAVLLIDDVCTTGATLNQCARVLKDSGAKKVLGLVIARG